MSLQKGDSVSVIYTGTLEDGTVFDTCGTDNPFHVVIGSEECLPVFENALVGRKQGEKFEIIVNPEDAYGERDDSLVHVLDKELFSDIEHLTIGMVLTQDIDDIDEEPIEVIVTDIDETSVTIDENHPLAGERLRFEVTVL